ncbi:MAG: hypothetical protein CMJ85_08875 [Planctomycetes bacterium]|jgi:hypothetical protein|nr:hypothetical protein [Planctomycetota bacterium]
MTRRGHGLLVFLPTSIAGAMLVGVAYVLVMGITEGGAPGAATLTLPGVFQLMSLIAVVSGLVAWPLA